MHRDFVFRNSKQEYNGIPVMASNMDTVGTFEMAVALGQVIAMKLAMCRIYIGGRVWSCKDNKYMYTV